MKKEYIVPSMRVRKMAARRLLSGSGNPSTFYGTFGARRNNMDADDFEEEDW